MARRHGARIRQSPGLAALTTPGKKLLAAAMEAGLHPDDPENLLAPVIRAMADAIDRLETVAAQAVAAAERAQQIDQATVKKIAQAAIDHMDSLLGELIRAQFREKCLRYALWFAICAAVTLTAGAAGGWWFGRQRTAAETLAIEQEIHRTSDEIAAAALKAGPERAALWRNLIDWNTDIRQALAYRRDCANNDGRTGCLVPLWVAPPTSDPPPANHR
jgi:hypothetical protein